MKNVVEYGELKRESEEKEKKDNHPNPTRAVPEERNGPKDQTEKDTEGKKVGAHVGSKI